MIHIATVHWRTSVWIDVQLRYLERNTRRPYRTYASLVGIDRGQLGRFDFVADLDAHHGDVLNMLAGVICDSAPDDDLLVFLDGDAFPIADFVPPVSELLDRYQLVAIRRDENMGDRQPHHSFCATTVGFWKEIGGDWSRGHPWVNSEGKLISEPGGKLLKALEEQGIEWYPLLRSNTHNPHPLWFGIYGDLIYHHGAGFRRPLSRVDAAAAPPKRHIYNLGRAVALARSWRRNRRLMDSMFEKLLRDEGFYRELVS